MARQSDFISATRAVSNRLIDAVNEARALRREWDSLDYGNTITEEAFTGDNAELDIDAIAAFFTSIDALEAVLAQGHATNLYALR
jgi:hypothetical protein